MNCSVLIIIALNCILTFGRLYTPCASPSQIIPQSSHLVFQMSLTVDHFVKFQRKKKFLKEKGRWGEKELQGNSILQLKLQAAKSTTQPPGDMGDSRMISELPPGPTGPGTLHILPGGLIGWPGTSTHFLLFSCTRPLPSVV